VLEYKLSKTAARRYIIDPKKGWSIVRMESSGQYENLGAYLTTIDITSRPVKGTSIWFPCNIIQHDMIEGEEIGGEEIVISDVKLNAGVSSEVFTLAGMRVRPGTHVLKREGTKGTMYNWDGKSLIEVGRRPRPKRILPIKPRRNGL
jgi:hypothetical protein